MISKTDFEKMDEAAKTVTEKELEDAYQLLETLSKKKEKGDDKKKWY